MSLGTALKGPEGIVLAADSQVTLKPHNYSHKICFCSLLLISLVVRAATLPFLSAIPRFL
jgi:hypothetical protein